MSSSSTCLLRSECSRAWAGWHLGTPAEGRRGGEGRGGEGRGGGGEGRGGEGRGGEGRGGEGRGGEGEGKGF